MATSSDRSSEWSILRTIFPPKICDLAEHSDGSDFLIQLPGVSWLFGVEVTEMFESETVARTVYNLDYLPKILGGGEHMHRADKSALSVNEVTVTHKDGTSEVVQAIVRRIENAETARLQKLVGIIEHKSTRPYREGLDFIDLIVRDRFDLMGEKREPFNVTRLMRGGIGSALAASTFNEVYWITIVEGPEGRQVYRPLRQLMLYEQFMLFLRGIRGWARDAADLTSSQFSSLFCDFCNQSGLDSALWDDSGDTYIVHRGVALCSNERGIFVKSTRHHLKNDAKTRPPGEHERRLTQAEFNAAKEFASMNELTCEFYLDAEENAILYYPPVTQARLVRIDDNDERDEG